MRARTIAFAAALASAVAGCAAIDPREQPPEQTGPGPCKAAVCVVLVTVKNCEVTVDDPEKQVPRDNKRPRIRFRLDPDSHWRYGFTEDGIAFKNDRGGQMRILGRSFLHTEFDIIDINDAPGKFEYRVKVKHRFGEDCPTKDPWIINN